MMQDRYAPFDAQLRGLAAEDRLRGLMPAKGHDFASNDYLALANDPRLLNAAKAALERGVPVGSGGSRLLRGNHPEHEALEAEAATFFGAQSCLYFGSGYAANLALLSTLPQRGDLIVYDDLIHASVHEGLKARRADAVPVLHNDPQAVDDAITSWRARGGKGTVWIVVESLYSMDGDRAPLADLFAIAERHDAFLMIDEAHATGVYGEGGRGLSEPYEGHPAMIALHTCGKALGVSGGLVTGDKRIIDFLINRARPFIFATAPSPLNAAILREALLMVADTPVRRTRLAMLAHHANTNFANRLGILPSGSQIIPVIIGENAAAMHVAQRLQGAGFDCRAVRPPTVPAGTARLRISITLHATLEGIDQLTEEMVLAMQEVTA